MLLSNKNEHITIFPCRLNLQKIERHYYVSILTIWNIKQCGLFLTFLKHILDPFSTEIDLVCSRIFLAIRNV